MAKKLYIEKTRNEIRKMSNRSKLYRMLKKELGILGYWKNKARGDSSKGFEAQQRSLALG